MKPIIMVIRGIEIEEKWNLKTKCLLSLSKIGKEKWILSKLWYYDQRHVYYKMRVNEEKSKII